MSNNNRCCEVIQTAEGECCCDENKCGTIFADLEIGDEFYVKGDEEKNLTYRKVKLWGHNLAGANSNYCVCLGNDMVYPIDAGQRVRKTN